MCLYLQSIVTYMVIKKQSINYKAPTIQQFFLISGYIQNYRFYHLRWHHLYFLNFLNGDILHLSPINWVSLSSIDSTPVLNHSHWLPCQNWIFWSTNHTLSTNHSQHSAISCPSPSYRASTDALLISLQKGKESWFPCNWGNGEGRRQPL